ncbi:MAG: LysM peptidoglycan-binding domain-containing protein [Chloroflexota bacterium]|nr:LysM peptidoglycan-binding domain-containing protein [Chloroflexota bacterium]
MLQITLALALLFTLAPWRASTTLAAPASVPVQQATSIYIVQRGDNLTQIARRFGTTVAILKQLNNLKTDRINVGQQLRVPAGGAGEAVPIRVSFPAGTSSATLTGSVTFPQRVCYVLGAGANQTMMVTITSAGAGANFLVRAANSSVNGGVPLKRLENEDRTWSGTLPVKGDYLTCVATPSGTVAYTLVISIAPLAPGCATPNQAIRTLDWAAVLLAETAVTHETIGGDDYITVLASTTGTGGIPNLGQIVYGDFDGDCWEEAAIPLISGGTAGDIGFIVYRYGAPRPTLIAWGDGYKLGLSVAANRLIVSNALYNGWEPNCCPSGRSYDTYRLTGNTLVLVSSSSEGFVEMQAETVRHFYELLQARDFAGAYALFSTAYQASHPFAAWAAGFADTVDFTFTVAAGAVGSNRVLVTIEATERTGSGGTRLRRYTGYWNLLWDGARPGWVLNSGSFAIAP